MKKQIQLSLLMTGLLSGFVAQAQEPVQQPAVALTQQQEPVQQPAVALTQQQAPAQPVAQVGPGNAFEKEVTPLLREISRKKSQLELRKLDRELERIDEESLKSQLELENTKNGGSKQAQNGSGVYDPFAGQPSAAPATPPVQVAQLSTSEVTSDIKVLMIYGFDNQLSAKIASGQQGGYVVKKGDVMPDGNIVANITSNYIEIKKNSKKSKGLQRIFVSSGVEVASNGSSSPVVGGNSGSAGALPQAKPVAPIQLPPQAQANEAAVAAMMAPIPPAK